MTTEFTARFRSRPRTTAVLTLLILLIGASLAWLFLGMRAVMAIGGACAEGGPFVSARPCPDGAKLMVIAAPLMIFSTLLGTLLALSIKLPPIVTLMWAALFGSLGWNFLEYAFAHDAIVVGWLVPGILFIAMAAPAFWWIAKTSRYSPATGAYLVLGALGWLCGWRLFQLWS